MNKRDKVLIGIWGALLPLCIAAAAQTNYDKPKPHAVGLNGWSILGGFVFWLLCLPGIVILIGIFGDGRKK
jgi:hypothetical protein